MGHCARTLSDLKLYCEWMVAENIIGLYNLAILYKPEMYQEYVQHD